MDSYIPSVGTVDADFVDLRRVLAEILYMAQDVAARVLADEIAEVRAQAHVGDGALVVTPFLDGDALEQDEAFAVDEILAQFAEITAQFGERVVGLFG